MTRETFVDERVIGREEVHDIAVFAHDAGKKQFRFLLEGQPQIVVEVRKFVGVGIDAVQISQMQPLTRKILRHRIRAWVGQHAAQLCFKDCGFVEAVSRRQIEQRVVRNAAPEKERQPRGEFDIADSCGVTVLRIALGAEHECWTCQQAPQRQLNAGIKRAFLAAFFIERKQKIQIGRRHRPPVGTLRKRGENLPGAGLSS